MKKQTFISYLFNSIKLWLFLKKASVQLWVAIRIANQKQRAYNKRFYVLPDYNNRLIALCRDDVNKLKRIKVMDKNVDHLSLMKECFYYTPLSLNNKGKITDKEKAMKKEYWLKYALKNA